jgi:hypothetical protein
MRRRGVGDHVVSADIELAEWKAKGYEPAAEVSDAIGM